jgi:putative protein-disulfide isomerase
MNPKLPGLTLIYVYDPLCGWCFGFHPVVEKLAGRFKDDLNFEVIPGGLATGSNAQTISEGYSYIRQGIGQVEQVTGVQFGENFKMLAEEGSYYYNSEASCIAQTVVNEISSAHAFTFAGRMLFSIFKDGKNLNDWVTFSKIFESLSIDTEKAKQLFDSEAIRKKTFDTFDWCKTVGATAFPTLLLKFGAETGVMSRGYRPYDTLESHLHHLINNIKKVSA